MFSSWSWAQPENNLSFILKVCHVRVFLTCCLVFKGLGVFSKLLSSQESIVHVWVTCRILLLCCAGVTVYKGELDPLWSLGSPHSALIGLHGLSFSPIGWCLLPGFSPPPNYQHVTLFLACFFFACMFTSSQKFNISVGDKTFSSKYPSQSNSLSLSSSGVCERADTLVSLKSGLPTEWLMSLRRYMLLCKCERPGEIGLLGLLRETALFKLEQAELSGDFFTTLLFLFLRIMKKYLLMHISNGL